MANTSVFKVLSRSEILKNLSSFNVNEDASGTFSESPEYGAWFIELFVGEPPNSPVLSVGRSAMSEWKLGLNLRVTVLTNVYGYCFMLAPQ